MLGYNKFMKRSDVLDFLQIEIAFYSRHPHFAEYHDVELLLGEYQRMCQDETYLPSDDVLEYIGYLGNQVAWLWKFFNEVGQCL